MSVDEPEPVGNLTLWSGLHRAVFECPVCLCLTVHLHEHKRKMEHGG